MSDPTDLDTRLATLAHDVRGKVVAPSYDDLVSTSRRRRRSSALLSTVATLVVVGLAWAGVHGLHDDTSTPTQPANGRHLTTEPIPRPTHESPPAGSRRLTAEQIVDASDSYLVAFAESGADPEAQVSVWRCREQPNCPGWRGGIAVTDDDFGTRTVIDLPRNANPVAQDVGDKMFLVGDAPNGVLLRPDGTTVAMTLYRTTGPLASGEVLVRVHTGPATFGGLDPQTGRVHLLAVPRSDGVDLQGNGSWLWGVAFTDTADSVMQRVIWSDDGGTTWNTKWNTRVTRLDANRFLSPLPSQRVGTMPFLVTSDGATLTPYGGVYGSQDGGQTWQSYPGWADPTGYVGTGLIQPDGSLLLNVIDWSDAGPHKPSRQPIGLYASSGTDWGTLQFVQDLPSTPGSTDLRAMYAVLTYVPDGQQARVWIYGNGHVFESGSGIDTWREIPVR
ncbi:MAG TPA: sialidase family protein [Nocardioidaceae bacterium]